MNSKYYDLSYTVIKNREGKGNVEEQEKINVVESDYNIDKDFIMPNHHVAIKASETTLR